MDRERPSLLASDARTARRPVRLHLPPPPPPPRTVAGAAPHELVFSVHNGWNFKSGDTSGLVADSAGAFHPVWIDNRSGWSQIWTAPVRVEGNLRALQDAT